MANAVVNYVEKMKMAKDPMFIIRLFLLLLRLHLQYCLTRDKCANLASKLLKKLLIWAG